VIVTIATWHDHLGGSVPILAADSEFTDFMMPFAFAFKFFLPGNCEPFQTLGFVAIFGQSKLEVLLPTVWRLAGFPSATKFQKFQQQGNKLVPIEFTGFLTRSGVLIFQLTPESADRISSFLCFHRFKNQKFALRDLLSGIKLDDMVRYVNHVR
jgi:hypothetical protein